MKEILNIESDPEYDLTQVLLHVPGFENFGARFDELEEILTEACLSDLAGDLDGTLAHLDHIRQSSTAKIEDEIEKTPDGPRRDELKSALGMLQQMTREFLPGTFDDKDDADDEEDDEDGDFTGDENADPHRLLVILSGGQEWNESVESRVDELLANWPILRDQVEEAVFEAYEAVYPEVRDFYSGADNIDTFLPPPTTSAVVRDLFRLETVHFHPGNVIGLRGPCIWDDDGGIDVRIQGKKVISAGSGDESEDD